MRMVILAVGLALVGSGAGAQEGKVVEIIPGSGEAAPTTLAEAQQRAVTMLPKARDVLDQQLVDYPSARFRSVAAHSPRHGTGTVYCGLLNSRNRAGGYTGWGAFALTVGDNDGSLYSGDSEFMVGLIEALCGPGNHVRVSGDFSERLTHR